MSKPYKSYKRPDRNILLSVSLKVIESRNAASLFGRNDIAMTRNPQPFVYAFSSLLGEEGRIMQTNNGAPLCQLAPIRRTYRLCQNRRHPKMFLYGFDPRGGVLYKRSQYIATQLHAP